MQKKQYVVWGLGRFGKSVALTLAGLGHEVLGIDSAEDIVQAVSQDLTHVVVCPNIDEATVNSLGLRNFDTAIIGIGDLEANLLCTMLLKEAGIRTIVAKASSTIHGKMLTKLGADKVIYPERDMGLRVAHNLASSNVMDYIELAEDLSLMEIVVTANLVGKSLIEADLRRKYGINVVAIKRGNKTAINLDPHRKLEKDDILVIIGNQDMAKTIGEGL